MKHNKLYILVAVIVLFSMVLAACVTKPTPTVVVTEAPATQVPVATTPPTAVPTKVPTEVPTAAPTFEPFSLIAPDCSYGGEFAGIEAVDELTVKFTLCYPDPAFLSKIAFSAFAIHSSDQIVATGGGGTELLENPIGTGPYMLSEWKRGDEIIFVQNPNYRGDPAKTPNPCLPLEL